MSDDELEYGVVLITGGEHAGKIGYYDDNDIDDPRMDDRSISDEEIAKMEDIEVKCVVYFGMPFQSDYALISAKNLKNTDMKSLPVEKFLKEYPDIAGMLGIYR